jgi:hypothetical protein
LLTVLVVLLFLSPAILMAIAMLIIMAFYY